jgi:hypothetical protein
MYSIKRHILTNIFDTFYLDNDTNLDLEWVKHNINYYTGHNLR